jgi:hypothetical protein
LQELRSKIFLCENFCSFGFNLFFFRKGREPDDDSEISVEMAEKKASKNGFDGRSFVETIKLIGFEFSTDGKSFTSISKMPQRQNFLNLMNLRFLQVIRKFNPQRKRGKPMRKIGTNLPNKSKLWNKKKIFEENFLSTFLKVTIEKTSF